MKWYLVMFGILAMISVGFAATSVTVISDAKAVLESEGYTVTPSVDELSLVKDEIVDVVEKLSFLASLDTPEPSEEDYCVWGRENHPYTLEAYYRDALTDTLNDLKDKEKDLEGGSIIDIKK